MNLDDAISILEGEPAFICISSSRWNGKSSARITLECAKGRPLQRKVGSVYVTGIHSHAESSEQAVRRVVKRFQEIPVVDGLGYNAR